MKRLTCEMCGSTDLIKQDGVFVCQSCGCKYSVEEAKKLMIEGTVEVKGTVKVDSSNEVNNLLKRAFMFLEEGNWDSAKEYCNKALDIDSENAQAYVGLLMSDLYVTKQEDLNNYIRPFDDNANYKKAIKYADEELRKTLTGYIEHIKTNPTPTKIHMFAFRDRDDLTSYVIPDGVTEIERCAFWGCNNLLSITIPDSVTTIGNSAFCHCRSLTSVTLGKNVTIIGDDAFQYCSDLRLVTFGNHVTEIGNYAFKGCKLRSINLPDSVTTVGRKAFEGCPLDDVSIPQSARISSNAFSNYAHVSRRNTCTSSQTERKDAVEETKSPLLGSAEKIMSTLPGTVCKVNVASGQAVKVGDVLCVIYAMGMENDILSNVNGIVDSVYVSVGSSVHTGDSLFAVNKAVNKNDANSSAKKSGGCYVATCVYGSYDCPQVWTLRRFRDNTLASTWYGRAFIKTYYAVSPTLVKWFGETKWFKNMWQGKLDRMVKKLNDKGMENTPYEDKTW